MTCSSLPKLPIPCLSETINDYLLEVKRLTTESQFERNLQNARLLLDDKNVQKIQNMLLEKAKVEDNWLSDYWLKYGYLKSRDSLVITTSPGLFLGQKSENKSHSRTIAEILQSIILYKNILERGKLKTETVGKYPLCMQQYYYILGVCRIPLPYEDQMHKYISNHITIAYKNAFFRFDLYDREGMPLSLSALENQLENFFVQNSEINSAEEPRVGVLTSWSRTEWANSFTRLHSDPKNKQNVKNILNSLFILCIDESPTVGSRENYKDGLLHHMLHGRGLYTGNRWFDKTLQFIYKLDDGCYGFTYEHTPAEGVALAKLAQMIVYPDNHALEDLECSTSSGENPTKLTWNINKEIQEDIESASLYINKKIENIDCKYLKFDRFGKNVIKNFKMSPDAFIQVAYQLVYYRLYKNFTATYESGATRRFIGGRTDTIRSCTEAACKFVVEADCPTTSNSVKRELLKNAVVAHSKTSLKTLSGEGTDRYLNAIKWGFLENRMTPPQFFSDEAYSNFFLFRLSTSQVPMPEDGVLVFGPACQDGYGICYNPQNEYIVFAITSYISSAETNSSEFSAALCDALEYLYSLLMA